MALVILALALVGLGGVVHTTGSSLACPDWPLCNGTWMPAMRGGVEYEHSHRLLALAVALGVAALPVVIGKTRPRARRLALVALGLVVVQALLGAATVIRRLPPSISIAHLLTASVLVALLAVIALEVRPPAPLPASPALHRATRSAVALLLAQIALGAMVRHLVAMYACGADPIGCAPALELLPPAILQVVHRATGLVVLGLVTRVAWIAHRDPSASASTRAWARVPLALTCVQIALGMAAIALYSPIALVTLHLVCAELLLLSLVVLAVRSARARLSPINDASPATGTLEGCCRATTSIASTTATTRASIGSSRSSSPSSMRGSARSCEASSASLPAPPSTSPTTTAAC